MAQVVLQLGKWLKGKKWSQPFLHIAYNERKMEECMQKQVSYITCTSQN